MIYPIPSGEGESQDNGGDSEDNKVDEPPDAKITAFGIAGGFLSLFHFQCTS